MKSLETMFSALTGASEFLLALLIALSVLVPVGVYELWRIVKAEMEWREKNGG
jgi:hypothetical protein